MGRSGDAAEFVGPRAHCCRDPKPAQQSGIRDEGGGQAASPLIPVEARVAWPGCRWVRMTDMTLDLAAYFERIDYHGTADPTLGVLQNLVTAHTRTIPFENLDPLLGRPIDDLSPEALTDKLVRRGRGGYCYEHNGLMGYVLEELGFGVRRFGARVVWTLAAGAPVPSQTHTLLVVTLPGGQQPYLVDVGFGGQTPTSPILLETGSMQQTTHAPHRLQEAGA